MEEKTRDRIWKMVQEGDENKLLEEAAVLHGHYCPGLALGVKASMTAMKRFESEHTGMEEVIAILETNNCFSDGVQYVTGCTFGNNSLVFRDLGKTAGTFVKRGAKGLRFVTRSDARDKWIGEFPEYGALFTKVVRERSGTEEDRRRMMEMAEDISKFVVGLEPEELFEIEAVEVTLPEYAPIHDSHVCEGCGESVMSTRTVDRDGKKFCLMCGGAEYFELDGHGMHLRGEKK